MSQQIKYVSEQRLLYFTQKLKAIFPTAADFIDDTAAALDKAYSSSKIDTLLADKVDKEEGKGLSTNDFDDDYKKILDDLDLTDIIDDTAGDTVEDKTWSAKKITTEILAKAVGVRFEKVTELPDAADGKEGTIYLVPNSGNAPNIYDEYIWIKGDAENSIDPTFEKIGTTDIDLSNYVQFDDLVEITTTEIDNIFDTVWPATVTPPSGE